MRYGVPQERDWNTLGDEEFRRIVSAEFADYPSTIRFPPSRLYWVEQKDWFTRIALKGWIAPGWPIEFGGMGLAPRKLLIYLEEQEHGGIARYQDHGVLMVGPVLIRYGTPEQQQRFLPRILNCEERWVQGYSEPEAGSDLASLRTTAVIGDDEFIVNGQKIWTTMAHDATHMFLIARTDPNVKKQAGISFMLLDLSTPGVIVRSIRDISGHEELCEVFLEDVRIPRFNLVGEPNQGWEIAKSLLGFERIHVGSPKLPEHGLRILMAVARESGALDDPGFRDRVIDAHLDVANLTDAYAHFAAIVARGEPLGPDVSLLKIWATETFMRIGDLTIDAAGEAGGIDGPTLTPYYKALPAVIYGGTNEIQRNVIARSVLDLPTHK